jgi:hypothetical protein
MKIIQKVLESVYFENKPPVLIDIGASGEINAKWKEIASYSVCIAFDADDREFRISEDTNKTYKRLISFNRIVVADARTESDFYLTDSPFCSSLLKPAGEKLAPWSFSELFKVTKVAKLPVVTLTSALAQLDLNYIDWFKTDTQGTDLRLFNSLTSELRDNILCAEFEPGILDAYEGEDKLYDVMQVMHNKGFWLSRMDVKGTQRLRSDYAKKIGSFYGKRVIRKSPGWAELYYLKEPPLKSERDFLLLYIFSLLDKQYGFALELMDAALLNYKDELFSDCRKFVWNLLMKEKKKTPFRIVKRQIKKIFRDSHD